MMKRQLYSPPEIEELKVSVEQGFYGSDVLEDFDPEGSEHL